MPSRRTVLATTASVLAAGCNQLPPSGDPNTTATTGTATSTTTTSTTEDPIHVPTQLPWQESTTYDGTTITPVDAWRQHSVFILTTPDSFGVTDAAGEQFLFVSVNAQGDGPIPKSDDFTLEAAGTRYRGSDTVAGVHGSHVMLESLGTVYSNDESPASGWIAVAVPTELDASSPKLRLQYGGEAEGATHWPLPEDVTTALNQPAPKMVLDTLVVPDSVPREETVTVELTAANRGSGPGTFRAAVNEVGPMYAPHAIRAPIPPGETRTESVILNPPSTSEVDEMRVRIVTADASIDRTITIK